MAYVSAIHLRLCKYFNADRHPARFPIKLPSFFINFLTEPGDTVVDIFAGSNTTGDAAESCGRNWIACDLNRPYLAASAFRFFEEPIKERHRVIFIKNSLSQTSSLLTFHQNAS
ncbi:MAG: DNA methyltransferase [bacterium]